MRRGPWPPHINAFKESKENNNKLEPHYTNYIHQILIYNKIKYFNTKE